MQVRLNNKYLHCEITSCNISQNNIITNILLVFNDLDDSDIDFFFKWGKRCELNIAKEYKDDIYYKNNPPKGDGILIGCFPTLIDHKNKIVNIVCDQKSIENPITKRYQKIMKIKSKI